MFGFINAKAILAHSSLARCVGMKQQTACPPSTSVNNGKKQLLTVILRKRLYCGGIDFFSQWRVNSQSPASLEWWVAFKKSGDAVGILMAKICGKRLSFFAQLLP